MNSEAQEIQPEWISYRDAQRLTGLSRSTLWKMTKAELIPASRQGRAVRLHRKSVEQVMWQGTQDYKAGAASLGEDECFVGRKQQ